MTLLALDAALSRCSAALVTNGAIIAERQTSLADLAPMVQALLAEAAFPATRLAAVAVTIGPGSFTGLRAAIALAHGIAAGAGCPVIGVSVAEALAEQAARAAGGLRGRAVWVAIDTRRGRVFLDRDGHIAATPLEALPQPAGAVAIAGDAAIAVFARMAARGDDVMLSDARLPRAMDVAAIAARRLAGDLAPLDAQPLYIDPPEARLPAGGLRPPPAA